MGSIMQMHQIDTSPPWLWIGIFGIIFFWDLIWKSMALWRSARNNDLAWFVCIIIFNTVGILPIVYLLTHKSNTGQNVSLK